MRWPWQRPSSRRLVVSWSGETLAFVLAKNVGKDFKILRAGVQTLGEGGRDDMVRQLSGLGLKGVRTVAMLKPEQYQLLQIEAPSVPAEELRSAARYQIKEMVDVHLDDLTIDVLRQGDGQGRAASQLFVIAANNTHIRALMELAQAFQWELSVIDVQDLAQRNLQTLVAPERAMGTLLISDARQALLTISAGGELYYSRRLDVPDGFMSMTWDDVVAAPEVVPVDAYTPVAEYVPDYARVEFGSDFAPLAGGALSMEAPESDRAQRLAAEVQRSIDLWDRTWANLPLAGLRVFAGARSAELAQWLARETGQSVEPLDVSPRFVGLDAIDAAHLPMCLPLLGVLSRTETRIV